MQMIKSLKNHSYGGKNRAPGTVYKAKDNDARLLVLVKSAAYHVEEPPAEVPEEKPKRTYTRKNLAANKPAGYDTKDMASN
jgi:hypothetical protein